MDADAGAAAMDPLAGQGSNQLQDLAASAWTNKFALLIGCGLCGLKPQNHSPRRIGDADSWGNFTVPF